MNRLLLTLVSLVVGILLIPGDAEAQRFGGRGGGGARVGGGGFGGGSGGPRMHAPRGGMGGGLRTGGAIAARPGYGPGFGPGVGGYRPTGIGHPGGRYDFRAGDGRYAGRPPGSYGGRYPVYGGRYPAYGGRYPYYAGRYPYYGAAYGRYPYYGDDYGGWGLSAGLVTGGIIGAAAASTYPPYSASSGIGGYCATTVRTCALVSAAPVGTGCSCRISNGRARGTVIAGP